MDSKQTGASRDKKQSVHDWMPEGVKGKAVKPGEGNKDKFRELLREDIVEEPRNVSVESGTGNDSADTAQTVIPGDMKETERTGSEAPPVQTVPGRVSSKQRKASLEEYRDTFLQVPKLEDRKPVFVSRQVRDQLDEIARKLGGRRMSVSGFIENLARHHLEMYRDDVEGWKKL